MMHKLKKEYFASLLSVIVVGAVLVVALYTFYDNSLAWFSNNKEVMAQGMSVVSRGAPKLAISVDNVVEDGTRDHKFTNLTPGDTVTFTISVTNKSGEPIDLRLLLGAPRQGFSTPYIVQTAEPNVQQYHYFDTQIRINSVKLTQGTGDSATTTEKLTLTGIDRYLMTVEESLYTDGLQPTWINGEFDFAGATDKVLSGDNAIQLADNETVTFTLELEFVDNGQLQNAYIDFNNSNGTGAAARSQQACQFICFAEFADQ